MLFFVTCLAALFASPALEAVKSSAVFGLVFGLVLHETFTNTWEVQTKWCCLMVMSAYQQDMCDTSGWWQKKKENRFDEGLKDFADSTENSIQPK